MVSKLQVDIIYTFNISPSDEYQYVLPPKKVLPPKGTLLECDDKHDRLKAFTRYWTKFMQVFTVNEVEFYLQTELSEPISEDSQHQVSRLHYHGYVKFPNICSIKWFLLYGTSLLSKTCRYTIGDITDPDVWYTYVTKQSFLELPILQQYSGIKSFYQKVNFNLDPVPQIDGVQKKSKRSKAV